MIVKSKSQTWRLARVYLAIIMTLTIMFSVIIFVVSSEELKKRPPVKPDSSFSKEIEEELSERVELRTQNAQNSIIWALIGLNIYMFFIGIFVSYALARHTLKPIEEAMQLQEQFVSDASHELRTPLTVLQINNELILRKRTFDEDRARDIFKKNISEVIKMKDLTEALLNLSEIGSGKFNKTEFDIYEIIKDVVDANIDLAHTKGIDIVYTIKHEKIISYAIAVRQILKILIENAIKYSPEGSKVEVLFHDRNIIVKDSGIGISKTDQKYIFDRFYRSDKARTRSDSSGYGLGLALAKTLSDKCGFNIFVASELGKGSEFILKI